VAINRQKCPILTLLESFVKSEKYKICGGTAKKIQRSQKHLQTINLRLLKIFPVSISLFISKCINSKDTKFIAFIHTFRHILAYFVIFNHHRIRIYIVPKIDQNCTINGVFTGFLLKSERGRMWGDAENKIQSFRKCLHTRMLRQ